MAVLYNGPPEGEESCKFTVWQNLLGRKVGPVLQVALLPRHSPPYQKAVSTHSVKWQLQSFWKANWKLTLWHALQCYVQTFYSDSITLQWRLPHHVNIFRSPDVVKHYGFWDSSTFNIITLSCGDFLSSGSLFYHYDPWYFPYKFPCLKLLIFNSTFGMATAQLVSNF